MKTWSKELVDKTRLELEDIIYYTDENNKKHWLLGSYDLELGAHFKNIDGKRFGIMLVEDAYEGKYIIKLKNSQEQETHNTIGELLCSGWALD